MKHLPATEIESDDRMDLEQATRFLKSKEYLVSNQPDTMRLRGEAVELAVNISDSFSPDFRRYFVACEDSGEYDACFSIIRYLYQIWHVRIEETIYQHANSYRNAIIAAQNDGRFIGDLCFDRFPIGCCGDASDMLAAHLLEKGIKTIWYSACRENHQSHAWLVLDDTRISKPTPSFSYLPKEIQPVMRRYGAASPDAAINITHYEAENLCDGLFIDITGDQFIDYSIPVFVGQTDRFHSSFEFVQAHDYDGLTPRLEKLYRIVERYIDLP